METEHTVLIIAWDLQRTVLGHCSAVIPSESRTMGSPVLCCLLLHVPLADLHAEKEKHFLHCVPKFFPTVGLVLYVLLCTRNLAPSCVDLCNGTSSLGIRGFDKTKATLSG
ncbi:hypothetical protein BaRGS_00030624 [Batillaria attramentaria]|uniref:Uncharacterized protein n=1 Tax=Batillaria attramentaria TaxID=370345 RepID=A0ABD0JTU0_9CAEN